MYAIKHINDIKQQMDHITFSGDKWKNCFTTDYHILKLGWTKLFYFGDEIRNDPINNAFILLNIPIIPASLMNGEIEQGGERLGKLIKMASEVKVSKNDGELIQVDSLNCFKRFFMDLFFSGKVSKVLSLDKDYVPKFDFFNTLLSFGEALQNSKDKCIGIEQKIEDSH